MRKAVLAGRAAQVLCLAAGLALAFSVGLMIWRGRMWTCGFYVAGPRLHLLLLWGAWWAWYALRAGAWRTAGARRHFLGRFVLLNGSLACALAAAEFGMRLVLSARQRGQSLEHLAALRQRGRPLPIQSNHALAAIIQPSANPRLVYELIPGLDTSFGGQPLRTNRDGMRADRDYPRARPPNGVRIVGLGDSGMFGWNCAQDENYLAVLEQRLRARGDGVTYEALNLAVPGYNTQLEAEMLRSRGMAYRPDLVVVGWCANDFSLPFFLWEKQNYWQRDVSYVFTLLFDRPRFARIASALVFRDRRTFVEEQVVPELTEGMDPAGVRRALADLRDQCARGGCRLLVFGPLKSVIRGLCDEAGVPYCNTYTAIPENKYPKDYLLYYMHPSPAGHRVLADYLERDLRARGWLPGPPLDTPAENR